MTGVWNPENRRKGCISTLKDPSGCFRATADSRPKFTQTFPAASSRRTPSVPEMMASIDAILNVESGTNRDVALSKRKMSSVERK